jgi:hypothetical protein
VFTTGGTTHAGQRAFLDSVANQRIQKPFDQALLRRLAKDSVGPRNS